jgi:hypothetical protein
MTYKFFFRVGVETNYSLLAACLEDDLPILILLSLALQPGNLCLLDGHSTHTLHLLNGSREKQHTYICIL